MSGSASIQRPIRPRMTTESSTTMTRSGSCSRRIAGRGLASAYSLLTRRNIKQQYKGSRIMRTPKKNPAAFASDQTDFMKFRRDDVLVNASMMYSLAPA